jgi:putative transposase
VLFRLAYLGVTNTLALLRLLPMSDRDKDAQILVLRHHIAVLERQLHGDKVRFTRADRAFLAALLHRLPRQLIRRIRLLVRPETVLRWHRDLVRRRHAAISRPKSAGRPTHRAFHPYAGAAPGPREQLVGIPQNPRRAARAGITVAASTVWEILREAGIDPAPERSSSTWADFLRSQADALLACDFLETVTVTGARMYVIFIEHASRRVRILGATTRRPRRG